MTSSPQTKLILASGSAIRAALLRNAGVMFDVQKIAIDEDDVKASFMSEGATAVDIARALAEMKALRAKCDGGQYIIGADQVLICEDQLFSKADNPEQLRDQLCDLCDKQHQLISAVCVAQNKQILWHHVATADLTMRSFSDSFLDAYLAAHEDDILQSVGGYQLEGPGIQLFRDIKGDYFTILGLPLLPLLDFLRLHGCVES